VTLVTYYHSRWSQWLGYEDYCTAQQMPRSPKFLGLGVNFDLVQQGARGYGGKRELMGESSKSKPNAMAAIAPTIFLVRLLDLPHVHSPSRRKHIKVASVPMSQGCELRTGKIYNWAKK
jgi:hypothetical protein